MLFHPTPGVGVGLVLYVQQASQTRGKINTGTMPQATAVHK